MKLIAAMLLAMTPLLTVAQGAQDMLQNLQKMQTCLENIDQTEVRALEQRSIALQANIRSWCAGGQRDKAQQQAMAFGNEVAKSKTVKQVAECTKMVKGMIPEMPLLEFERDLSAAHICDMHL